MHPGPILYQDFVDGVLTVLSASKAPDEPLCSICRQEYGKAGPGTETSLEYLSQLPGAFKKTFIQDSVDAVITRCGHTYCTYCISVWLTEPQTCTCPLCRAPIHLPAQLISDNTDDGLPDVGVEGLTVSLHIRTPEAQAIFNILRLSTRELLTTETPMPFVWNTEVMLSDLPKVMVTIARRFHYQSRQGPVLADLSFMRLHNPIDRLAGQSRRDMDLNFFSRSDAPLAKHPDAHKLYSLLCKHIENPEKVMSDEYGRCQNWETPAKTFMYKVFNEGMSDAHGGIGQESWRAYIRCVTKALLVWQAYCERVQRLSATHRPG